MDDLAWDSPAQGQGRWQFLDTTFHSPQTVEYHLPMHNHGRLDPDIADEMLTCFRAGCSDESLPVYYSTFALTNGAKGAFNC